MKTNTCPALANEIFTLRTETHTTEKGETFDIVVDRLGKEKLCISAYDQQNGDLVISAYRTRTYTVLDFDMASGITSVTAYLDDNF